MGVNSRCTLKNINKRRFYEFLPNLKHLVFKKTHPFVILRRYYTEVFMKLGGSLEKKNIVHYATFLCCIFLIQYIL